MHPYLVLFTHLLLTVFVVGCSYKIQRFTGNLMSNWNMPWDYYIALSGNSL